MKRSASKWNNSVPEAMARQSKAAITFAFEDAKADILQMAEMLRIAAYPKRGTDEESMDEFDVAEMIQANFTLEDLDI